MVQFSALPDRMLLSAQEVQDAAEGQRRKFFGTQGGRAFTRLTGGSGTGTPQSAVVSLLGQAGRI